MTEKVVSSKFSGKDASGEIHEIGGEVVLVVEGPGGLQLVGAKRSQDCGKTIASSNGWLRNQSASPISPDVLMVASALMGIVVFPLDNPSIYDYIYTVHFSL